VAFPTTGILDDFNRADANPLDGSWTNGFWGDGNLRLVSNQIYAVSGWGGARYNAATYGADSEVYLSIPYSSTVAFLHLRVGGTDADPDSYAFRYQSGDAASNLRRLDDGVQTQLGAAFTATISTSNDKLGLEAIGSTITAYRYVSGAWASLASRTDATYSSAGYLAVEFDQSVWKGDDFGGGTVVSGVRRIFITHM